MRRHNIGAGLLLAVLVIAGCGGAEGDTAGLRMDWSISPDPPRIGPSLVHVSLMDSAGVPVSGAEIELEANMSHPGMRPILARATETKPGHYTAPLAFTMAGDYFILITATLPDGRIVDWQIDVTGVTG